MLEIYEFSHPIIFAPILHPIIFGQHPDLPALAVKRLKL
jgi:hypothetical protein